ARAGGDDDVVDRDVADSGEGGAVARVARGGDGERDVGEVDGDGLDVAGALVRSDEHGVDVDAAATGAQELAHGGARLDDAGHEAALDGHVGEDAELVDVPLIE